MLERRAERALREGAERRAGHDSSKRRWSARARARPRWPPAHTRTTRPAAVPSSEIAPGVPGGTADSVWTSKVRRPNALPISLATVSLPPAVSAATKPIIAAPVACVVDREQRRERRDAGVGDRVARAAPSAALLRDAEQRLAPQPEPRGDRRGEKRDHQQHPALPAGGRRRSSTPMQRADDRLPTSRRSARDVRRRRRPTFSASADRDRCENAWAAADGDRVVLHQRRGPQHAGGRHRHGQVVVQPDRNRFRQRRDGRRERTAPPARTTDWAAGSPPAGTTTRGTRRPRRRTAQSASDPATLFVAVPRDRAVHRTCVPTIVAMPSPAARMPHAAATMSRRAGKTNSRSEHRQRIEQHAGRVAARVLRRAIETRAADARQHEAVERERLRRPGGRPATR